MNQNELKKYISSVLGEDVLEELKEWYLDTLADGWVYVVFIVRRSYILALLMEMITGKTMCSNESTHYLTDASFILHCEALAEAYRKDRRFPSILLCDDVCKHGRSINHFIETIEQRLVLLLPEFDRDDIKEALLKALRIHVYVRAEGPLLLLGKYEFSLSFKRKENPRFIHGFSSDISMIILRSGIANPNYIYSESIPVKKFEAMDLSNYIKTSYQNTTEYAGIKFVGSQNAKKAIFTLRVVKGMDEQCYIHPFVFMPNLGAEETEELLLIIQDRMRARGVPEEYIMRLGRLEQIPGKRTFNEMITLLFSFALLQDFNREYNITPQPTDEMTEIVRLARNYDWYGFHDAEKWLGCILSEQLFTLDEIEKILDNVILPERRMIYIHSSSKNVLSHAEKMKIRDKMEDYLYTKGHEEEQEAYELSRNPFVHSRRRMARTVRGCGFLLWELSDGCTELEAEYHVAYLLQMVDAGVVCLSSFAPNYKNVVGMSQFAKTGEQSLMSVPLKFYEWIPMLSMIENDCEENQEEFYLSLEEYCASPQCSLDWNKFNEIEEFVESIYSMGHKILDWSGWNISYLNKLEIDLPGTEDLSLHKKRLKFMDLQIKHMEDYKNYKRYF